jgi:hypothetical protein
MPTIGNGLQTGGMLRWVDCAELLSIMRNWREMHSPKTTLVCPPDEALMAVIERPLALPNQRVQTAASSFDTFGTIRCAMAAAGIHTDFVAPSEWKKLYGLQKKGNGSQATREVKAQARAIAKRMYPNAPVHLAKFADRAEAILIANWALTMKKMLDGQNDKN